MLVLRIMLMYVSSRSHINMSKSDLTVRSDIIVSDEISVLRIMLMSLCSRSDINMSKSNLGVTVGISVKNDVNVSV